MLHRTQQLRTKHRYGHCTTKAQYLGRDSEFIQEAVRAYRLDSTDPNVLPRLLVVLLLSLSNQRALGMVEWLGALGLVVKFRFIPESLVTLRWVLVCLSWS